jgi:hypothetical protein
MRGQEQTWNLAAITPLMEATLLTAELMGKITPGTKPNAVASTLFADVGKGVQPSGHRPLYPQGVMDYGVPRLASLREALR